QFQMHDRLALYGGFNGTETNRNQRDWVANPTILEGNTGAGQTLILVLASSGGAQRPMTNSLRLDGFTLQHAQSGIRIDSSASVTVENCVIGENQMGAVLATLGDARFINCDFVTNGTPSSFGSGLNADNSTFYVDRCFFRGNRAASSA